MGDLAGTALTTSPRLESRFLSVTRRVHPEIPRPNQHRDNDEHYGTLSLGEIQQQIAQKTGDYSLIGDATNVKPDLSDGDQQLVEIPRRPEHIFPIV
jgi:hypothetical protein